MPKVYIYVVDRDFGFAPNPFHGTCTLATCKPRIRSVARENDWVFGLGGGTLKATGRCIFAMKVTAKLNFTDYWNSPDFRDKIPVRNGSKRMMVGDNIYRLEVDKWFQAQSHHSNQDGTVNLFNLKNDTSANAVLISSLFFYFGRNAPEIPPPLLENMGYKNRRHHRTFKLVDAQPLVDWVNNSFRPNLLLGDPFDFYRAQAHYSGETNKISA